MVLRNIHFMSRETEVYIEWELSNAEQEQEQEWSYSFEENFLQAGKSQFITSSQEFQHHRNAITR